MKTRIRQLTEQEKRSLGESQMITDWLEIFPKGILSIVSDTFDLWKLITEYLPANKDAIMARDGKLVIRPDSGDPVDIICGHKTGKIGDKYFIIGGSRDNEHIDLPEAKGVIELLWDIFGGTINEQGYKVLDPHIGAIYGDSITPERQVQIYERLEAKGFAATNIILGIGSFTYQYNTRDTLGWAAKGAWFEVSEWSKGNTHNKVTQYNIYKDPVTDDGTKKSLKGLLKVTNKCECTETSAIECGSKCKDIYVITECTPEEENEGLLQVIYEDGKFHNQTTLTEVRERLKQQ